MSLDFEDLNELQRGYMLEELDYDLERGSLYLSKRLNERGIELYPQLLRMAIKEGNDATFAHELLMKNCLKSKEERTVKGKAVVAKVPSNAHTLLAEGEFNRFYIRGMCLGALKDGSCKLEIYRAKQVSSPRQESEAKIGQKIDPDSVLNDLRVNVGTDTVFGLPPGPNSGLSVRKIKN